MKLKPWEWLAYPTLAILWVYGVIYIAARVENILLALDAAP